MSMRKAIVVAVVSLLLAGGPVSAQTGSPSPTPGGPFSFGAEALVWWFKSSPTPVPIVTDGLFGTSGTNVLLGGGDLDTDPNPGFRLTAGYGLSERWGLEGSFLYIPSRST